MVELDGIFKAFSIAVVGASTNREKTGHIVFKNIVEGGFKGPVYPINPKAGEILGQTCYPSLQEIPAQTVDLVIIIVPAHIVPDVLRQVANKKAKGAIIISGGFRETGNDQLETEIVRLAKQHGIRLLGPNCQGVAYPHNDLCAAWPLMREKGSMAIISQSGTVGAACVDWAEKDKLGVSAFVSMGNKCDVDEVDLMGYFATDDTCKALGIYLEGVRNGSRYMEVGHKTAMVKPIVVLRSGRTRKGRMAAASHTKSIAGDHKVFDAATKQAGIIKADTVHELYDFLKILTLAGPPVRDRCLVITSSGGAGILAADVADCNVDIFSLKDETKRALKEELPAYCIIGNPLDLTGDTDARRYATAVETIAGKEDFDVILVIFGDPISGAADMVKELKEKVHQAIIACYIAGGEIQQAEVQMMHAGGIPVFPTPERAMKAIAALIDYGKNKKKAGGGVQ